jgi:hypothetical protein
VNTKTVSLVADHHGFADAAPHGRPATPYCPETKSDFAVDLRDHGVRWLR